jgi:hypothetical protein
VHTRGERETWNDTNWEIHQFGRAEKNSEGRGECTELSRKEDEITTADTSSALPQNAHLLRNKLCRSTETPGGMGAIATSVINLRVGVEAGVVPEPAAQILKILKTS